MQLVHDLRCRRVAVYSLQGFQATLEPGGSLGAVADTAYGTALNPDHFNSVGREHLAFGLPFFNLLSDTPEFFLGRRIVIVGGRLLCNGGRYAGQQKKKRA